MALTENRVIELLHMAEIFNIYEMANVDDIVKTAIMLDIFPQPCDTVTSISTP